MIDETKITNESGLVNEERMSDDYLIKLSVYGNLIGLYEEAKRSREAEKRFSELAEFWEKDAIKHAKVATKYLKENAELSKEVERLRARKQFLDKACDDYSAFIEKKAIEYGGLQGDVDELKKANKILSEMLAVYKG